LVYANSAAARRCGYESGEALVADDPAEIASRLELLDVTGATLDANHLPSRAVLRGTAIDELLVRVRDRRSGREGWSLIRSTPVLGKDGKPELAVNIWRDVTAA